jgi:GrpB-like predicted nucleotidyltransferase (UPF0157 family)/8-oxo-dGTP pyrophosphatase MutT (NUDIX family)
MTPSPFPGAPARYSGQWPALFAKEAATIREACGSTIVSLEHIGSTSIAGMLAKPVLDMLIEARRGEIALLAKPLEGLGYTAKGENGIPGRSYFSRAASELGLAVHIHSFKQGHPEIAKHLAFRDYLRSHREVAREYAELKASILKDSRVTRDQYQNAKNDFLVRANRDAMEWRRGRGSSEFPVKKVVIYVFRQSDKNVLVFDHANAPEASPQVPSGTVDGDENLLTAAKRELREESGLSPAQKLHALGSYVYYKSYNDQFQVRNIFLVADDSAPDRWTHRVTGAGEDADLEFRYRWMPMERARSELKANLGDGLEYFREDIDSFV